MNERLGTESLKARENFGTGELPRELIQAYAEVKLAVLSAIQQTEKRYSAPEWKALRSALDEIRSGKLDDAFRLPLSQGGAGTSIHMNINETAAIRATEILRETDRNARTLDPLDDLNPYQSTNDTFPTAVTVALYRELLGTESKVVELQETLVRLENKYPRTLLTARTELQAAFPITLAQVIGSWAGMIERDRWRLHKLKERIRTIALGGTAVGTGYPAPREVVFASEKFLRDITGLPLTRSQNLPDEIAHTDKWSELASGLKLCAENLFKMSGDLMLYTSSLSGEMTHPRLQAGSTIMAAKTNPVALELARGLSMDVQGEAYKVSLYSQNGQFQLNAYLPFIYESLHHAFGSLNRSLDALLQLFLPGFEVNEPKMESALFSSNAILSALIPLLGYHGVEKLYKMPDFVAPDSLSGWKAFLQEHTGLSETEIEQWLDPVRLTSFRSKPQEK